MCEIISSSRHALKGRRGEDNIGAKLTNEQVLEIRASKALLREIAERFNITIVTAHLIRARKRWKHI